jgi:acyl-CoA reductase-like NAD-dependent aldehyde dehydrogenase
MITEQQEVARYRVAEQLRAAEARARRNEGKIRSTPREGLAGALRRLADRLEPASRRLAEPAARALTEPQPRHRRTGLSIVR